MDNYGKLLEDTEKLAGLVDIDELMKTLARLLQKTVQSRWVVGYLFDRDSHSFSQKLCYKLPSHYQPLFKEMPLDIEAPPVRNLLRKGRHLPMNDPLLEGLLPPCFRNILQRHNVLLMPMAVRNQVTGVIFVARSKEIDPFSQEEVGLINDIVSHAALVASHMRLFDESLDMAVEMAKGIDLILTLDEINKAISSSLSRDKIIETAMQSIERITRCELVALLEEEKGELVVIASHAYGPPLPPQLQAGARPVSGECAVWNAFTMGKSFRIRNLDQMRKTGELDGSLAESGISSLLAIPLLSNEKVKGVLLVGGTRSDQFDKDAVFAIEKIAAQMAVALVNAKLYEDMRSLFINTVASLANVIDAKSPWTKGHSERVMHIASNIAKELGLDEQFVERVRLGGLLHDIGKIGIMEALLEKPEILTEDEFPPLRLHPQKGVTILAPIEQLEDVLPAILHHHERYDGTGYPMGLKGEEIPLAARIVTVADSFDAMVEDRPYHKGLTLAEAIRELQVNAGTQFDPMIVEHFVTYIRRISAHTTATAQAGT